MKILRFVFAAVLAGLPVRAQVDSAPFLENSGVFNPLDYGADPAGAEDSSPAFNAMLADIGTRRQIAVFIPPGQYRLASRITFAAPSGTGRFGLAVRGGGLDATELRVDNNAGGFFFDCSAVELAKVNLSDLTFVAERTNIAAAVGFEIAEANSAEDRQFCVENVYVTSPHHTSPNYFHTAFDVQNAWGPRFCNVHVRKQGVYSDPIRWPVYGIRLRDCRAPVIKDTHINKVQNAIVHVKDNWIAGDGIVVNCYLVSNERALDLQFRTPAEGWPKPQFHIDNCHFNYDRIGVNAVGVRQLHISHVLFYCSERGGSSWYNDGTPVADFDPVDINLEYANSVTIDHNQFVEPSSPRRRAIQVSADSSYVLIDGNQFNMEGTAVYNESSGEVHSINNMFGGMSGDFTGGGAWLTRYTDTTGSVQIDDLN
jgi:hypothetical protein